MPDQIKYTQYLKDKRVLVIGGSSGIGYCVAEALVEHGSHVIVSSSNASRIEKTISRLTEAYSSAKGSISGHTVDMSDEATLDEQIKTLLDKATSNGSQKLDHIISTAGNPLSLSPIKDITFDQVQKAGMIRFFAPLFIAKHAPAYMNSNTQSSIVLSGGSVAERPIPNWTVVNSYATGLQGMVRGLALDLKPIRVNMVQPGPVDTELWDSMMSAEAKAETLKGMSKGMVTGKVASPEQVAEAYLYLMKDGNADGSIVGTEGGALLLGPS